MCSVLIVYFGPQHNVFIEFLSSKLKFNKNWASFKIFKFPRFFVGIWNGLCFSSCWQSLASEIDLLVNATNDFKFVHPLVLLNLTIKQPLSSGLGVATSTVLPCDCGQ